MDYLAPYEAGMAELLRRLGPTHPHYDDALTWQARLLENIRSARAYGDTEALRAARARVIDLLNQCARATLGSSFNALCGAPEAASPPAPSGGRVNNFVFNGPVTGIHTGDGDLYVTPPESPER